MVVGAADAGAAVRVDVDGGRQVELGRARAVAYLPDREELRQAPAVARRERRPDGVEGMRQRARDRVLVQVGGDDLDVAGVRLQPVVVVLCDAQAEDVHELRLATEASGELLRDERVRAVGDLQCAGDRVVVGHRHEVHAAPLGQRIDILRRSRALGQPERALHPEARDLRGGGVDVQVGSCHRAPGSTRFAGIS
jgi:hypothetical protein